MMAQNDSVWLYTCSISHKTSPCIAVRDYIKWKMKQNKTNAMERGLEICSRLYNRPFSKIPPLFVPPKICIKIVFNSSLDICKFQEKLKTMLMQNFLGRTKSLMVLLYPAVEAFQRNHSSSMISRKPKPFKFRVT